MDMPGFILVYIYIPNVYEYVTTQAEFMTQTTVFGFLDEECIKKTKYLHFWMPESQ